jgi:GT2 family glycosyltransferase
LIYLSELETLGITILRYPHAFNYSAINNFAVKQTKGDYLCFLNNDVEVISEDWLEYLLYWATRERVGAVGARLLYPDGNIQHAGLVVGMGGAAGHLHRFDTNPSTPGYTRSMLNAAVTTEVSAVTAACLVVKRECFERVSGFDQTNLAIAYNDVDFCLKLNALGYKNIYCADAQLYHHESVSRGDDLAPDKVQRYMKELHYLQRKWHTKTYMDPLFSQHLHLHIENQPLLSTARRFTKL